MAEKTPVPNPPANDVPMFGPDGVLRDVPYNKMHEAVANGMKPGVRVKFPDDSDQVRYVPPDKFLEATHEHKAQVLPIEDQSTDHPGFWSQVGSVVKQMMEAEPIKWGTGGLGGMLSEAPKTEGPKLPTDEENAARKAKGLGPTYRALVPAAEAAGVDVKGMEQAADEGDVAGVQARAAVPAAIALAHPAAKVVENLTGVTPGSVASAAASHVPGVKTYRALKTISNALKTAAEEHRAAVEPEAPSSMTGPSQIPPDFTPQRKIFGGRTVPPLPDAELARMNQARADARARQPVAAPPEASSAQPVEAAQETPEAAAGAAANVAREQAAAAPVRQSVSQGGPAGPAAPKVPGTADAPFEGGKPPVEEPVKPEPKLPPVRDAKTGRMVSQSSDLLKKASGLRQPVRDLVDSVIDPGTSKNLAVKSQVEFYLNKGDVAKAQAALDAVKLPETQEKSSALSVTDPSAMATIDKDLTDKGITPAEEKPVIQPVYDKGLARDPQTGRVLNKADSLKLRKIQDKLEDKGIMQDLDKGLTDEGRAAYREFLKSNSPATKGELTGTTPDMPGWGRENKIPKAKPDTKFAGQDAGPQAINDLREILERSKRQVDLMKQAGATKGAVQEFQAKKFPVSGGTDEPVSDAARLKAESEKKFQIEKDLREKPDVKPFFSKAAWVTDEKIPTATSGDSALATLRNAGVKEGEIKWMGLDDYLKGKTKVSRADIQSYIKEHEIKLGEVTNTEKKGSYQHLVPSIEESPNGRFHIEFPDDGTYIDQYNELRPIDDMIQNGVRPRTYLSREEAMQGAHAFINDGPEDVEGKTKYPQYTLPGEKSNYTEKLLTLPEKITKSVKEIPEGHTIHKLNDGKYSLIDEDTGEIIGGRNGFDTANEAKEAGLKELSRRASKSPTFKSGHFDEPNVLAHVRYDDRVDAAGKKTLFLEEAQSDWHQKGKREGYQNPKRLSELDTKLMKEGKLSPDEAKEYDRLSEMESLPRTKGGVPDAPFKSDWHELVMKRMLREAAEKGYDKLAWTTGEQQAERYDLSKHIDRVDYFPNDKALYAYDKQGGQVLHHTGIEPEKIQDYVGKDAAKKLVESEPKISGTHGFHSISGEDLKVGGEWAKRLYDQAIPNFLNKYAKKWGAKVSTTEIGKPGESPEQTSTPAHLVLDRLDKNFEKLQEHLTDKLGDPGNDVGDAADIHELFGNMTAWKGTPVDTQDRVNFLQEISDFKKIPLGDVYKAYGESTGEKLEPPSETHKVHSIDITPEMKRDVLKKGQPIAKNETASDSAVA